MSGLGSIDFHLLHFGRISSMQPVKEPIGSTFDSNSIKMNNCSKRLVFSSLLALSVVCTPRIMNAQVTTILMTTGTVDVCVDSSIIYAFADDEGQQPYSDTTYTLTICPNDPGDALIVDFFQFSTFQSPLQGQSDELSIFDGPTTSDQWLGTYSGNALQSLTISASYDNPGGCLTFLFEVNTGNGGDLTLNGWEAAITCGTPCENPIADPEIISEFEMIEDVPVIKVCVGDEVEFGDEGSYLPSGNFPLENYIWNFDDGVVDTLNSPSNVTHEYTDPGAYNVNLLVSYDNGTNECNSFNIEPIVVWVSTPALFNTEVVSPLCVGEYSNAAIEVNASPISSDLWSDAPSFDAPPIAATGFGAGASYFSPITFDFFEPDAVIENCDQILSIQASLEHSYLGDLEIVIECPNGTQVMLQEQAGGGIYLGEPVDVELDFAEGVCYDYGWSETSELGTLDEGNTTLTDYTDTQGNFITNANILDAGLYEPFESLCGLEGCPLNGTWQLGFTDWLGLDNGFMCTWNLNLDPNLLPGVTVIQPEIIELNWDFDLIAADELVITPDSDNPEFLDIVAYEPGTYNIGLEAINDFGCGADTLLEIVVIGELEVDAGADQVFCGTEVILSGFVVEDPGETTCSNDAGNYSYCYVDSDNTSFTFCPDAIGDGTKMVVSFSEGTIDASDALNIYDGPDASSPLLESYSGDLAGQTWVATNPGGCLTIVFTSNWWVSCGSSGLAEAEWCVSCLGGAECAFNYSWEPDIGLNDSSIADPTVSDFGGLTTTYTLFVHPDGYPGCVGSDQVDVMPGFEFTVDYDNPSCILDDGFVAVNISESPSEGPWTVNLLENGTLLSGVVSNGGVDNFTGLEAGNYQLQVGDSEGCQYEIDVVLTPPPTMDFDLTPNPNICINGFATIETSSDMDPGQTWTYSWDNGLGTGDVQVVNPIVDTDYTVFATDVNGCTSDAQTVTVQVYDSLNVSISAPDLICGGAFAELEADVFNGGSGAGYSFNWSWQNNPVGGDESYWVDYPQATGTYCVTLTDNCESPAVTECEEVVIETPIPAAFTSDTTRSCVPGVFQFESLVDPALIAQTEWFFGDGELSYDANPAHAYLSPGSYDITFNITSLVGCEYVNFQPNYLQVFTPPYVGFTATPQPTRVPDTEIQFESVNSTNVVDWFWLFDSIQYLGASNQPNPLFEFPIDEGGNYPVTLVVTDENGCSSQITRTIEILDLFSLYIPTAFSPNNDGTNDAFFAVGTDIDPARFSMQVINRWGNLVFETTDVNEVWYGKSNDASEHFAQDGVYFYRVVVYSLSNPAERKEIKGAVSLMR